MSASRAAFVRSTTGTRPRSQTTSSTTTTAAIAAQQPVMATAPKPASASTTPSRPWRRLADHVGVGEVLHPLERLEGGLEGLGDLGEDRRGDREPQHDPRVAAHVREPQVRERREGEQRRERDPQHERRPEQPRRVLAPDDHLAHEVVARAEAEHDAEHARDRPGRDDDPHARRAERARDDERPEQRHRPRDDLAARHRADVARDAGGAVGVAGACSESPSSATAAPTRTAGTACPGGRRPRSAGRSPIVRAGTPATIASGGTSRVTTAPAHTTLPRPSVTPGRTIARVPIQTWSSIRTGRVSTGKSGAPRRCDAVRTVTSGETLTSSPIQSDPRTSRRQSRLMRVRAPSVRPSRRTWPGP